MPKPKVDHTNTICCICKSNKTYMDGHKPVWYTCKCGNKDCKRYICYKCKLKERLEKNREEHAANKDIKATRNTPVYLKNIECCECGKTGDCKSVPYLCYDKKGDWDGRSRLCRHCYNHIMGGYGTKIEKSELSKPISREHIDNNIKIEGVKNGTLVLTDDLRYIRIEEIHIGDVVVGLSPDLHWPKFSHSTVSNILKGERLILEIYTLPMVRDGLATMLDVVKLHSLFQGSF